MRRLWRVWHGRIFALVCAGVINFADAVRLVEMRGKFVKSPVPEGAAACLRSSGWMMLCTLQNAAKKKMCREGRVVSPVATFAGRVVIAGHKEAGRTRGRGLYKTAGAETCAAAGERTVALRADETSGGE